MSVWEIQFGTHVVICIRDALGLLVPIRPVCKNIGIGFPSQKKRILETPELQPLYKEVQLDGKKSTHLCLGIEDFHDWLNLIKLANVSKDRQEELIRYRDHCKNTILMSMEMSSSEPSCTALSHHAVSFYGDDIICVRDPEGKPYASVKHLCQNIGIVNYGYQYNKIKNDGVLRYIYIDLPSAGGSQATFCIHIDDIPMWLSGVSLQSVSEHISERLSLYKRECGSVLRRFFYNEEEPDNALVEQIKNSLEDIYCKINIIEQQQNEYMYRQDLKIKDLESSIRTMHATRIVELMDKWFRMTPPSRHDDIYTTIKHYLEDELDPYGFFKLYQVFRDINPEYTKDQASRLATDFRKETDVDKYQQGTISYTAPNGKTYVTKRYERRDYDEIRDMAIDWLRRRQHGTKQLSVWNG